IRGWTPFALARYPRQMPFPQRLPSGRVILAAWMVPALLSGFQTYMQSRLEGGAPPWRWIAFNSIDWLLCAVLTPFVFRLARRWPLERAELPRRLVIHMIGALGMCVAWAGMGTILREVIFGLPAHWNWLKLFLDFLSWLLTTLPFGVGVYFALVGIEHS